MLTEVKVSFTGLSLLSEIMVELDEFELDADEDSIVMVADFGILLFFCSLESKDLSMYLRI